MKKFQKEGQHPLNFDWATNANCNCLVSWTSEVNGRTTSKGERMSVPLMVHQHPADGRQSVKQKDRQTDRQKY